MFERESIKRMAQVAREIQRDVQHLDEQWDELDVRARDEEMNGINRKIRLLARLLRNIRNGGMAG